MNFPSNEQKNYLFIQPAVYLQDQIGEHDSFFLLDPNGYHLEFKTFNNPGEIFKSNAQSSND